MIYTDSHVHTRNSPDGNDSVLSLIGDASAKGLSYLATTDHLDYDLKYGDNRTPVYWNHIKLDKYYEEWKTAAPYAENFKLAFGIEAGFEDDDKVCAEYEKTLKEYPFDVVINSVHFVGGWDVYFKTAFAFKSKKQMYGEYLDKVLKSLDAPYRYDIVAHLGYVTRNAPYRDKELNYRDFADKFDAVLSGVIKRDKALEVNTHHDMNPTEEILKRYYELGGRKLSFGSDSHRRELCKDFETVSELLKNIGFTHFTVFTKEGESQIPIG